MTKVAILGCGWLGLPLALQLLKSGYQVNGSTTSIEKEKTLIDAGIKSFVLDLDNFENNLNEFLDVEELIITIPPRLKNHKETIKNLISKIESSTIKRVTYTSSISVYGNTRGLITEETKVNPTRDTVVQITEIEQLLLNNTNFKSNIIRLGGLIGPNRHPAYRLSEKIIQSSNELINLVHLEDCIAIIEKLIKSDISNEIFNLVNPHHPQKRNYYNTCCETLNLPAPLCKDNPNPIIKEVSSKKLCKSLNYVFKNNLIL